MRYLSNAIGKASALPHAVTGYRAIGGVRATVYDLDKLLDHQLAGFYQRQAADDPNLYDDWRDPAHTAGDTAREVAIAVEHARELTGQLAVQLDAAHAGASHLGG